jgi:hypothetical protein
MYCDICRGRLPPPLARPQALPRKCACTRSQSTTLRSQSVPRRPKNLKQFTTPRSRSARRLNIHERRTWYEGPRIREQVDAVDVEGGESQPPVSYRDSGIYKKLDESKRQIRLLELHPGSGEEPISGNLITVDLPALPPDFDEHLFLGELAKIATATIFPAVRSGNWVPQNDVDRWEFLQNSLIWLYRYRLLESYHILRDAHVMPTMDTVGRLKGKRLSRSAHLMQKFPNSLAMFLLLHNTHHSWDHDLNGLIARISAQGKRTRDYISHFAKQMDTAIDNFVSEDGDGDGMSALTSVDVPGLERFLAEVDLGLCPIFRAVSWFWGDAKPGEKIELDGKSLDVPLNAVRALHDLRDSVRSKMLWIDAVCINQDDRAERASQILLMSDVYSTAGLTYLWLGNDDVVIRRAIVHLKDVLRCLQKATDFGIRIVDDADADCLRFGMSNLSANGFPVDVYMGLSNPAESIKILLQDLPAGYRMTQTEWLSIFIPRWCASTWPIFELPWFSRLWVFQEAVLSRGCTVVFSPNTTLSWKDLEDGAYLMKDCLGGPEGLHLTLRIRAERACSHLKKYASLRPLVADHIDQACSDPRDHIYGLLGLTVWTKRRQRWPYLIQPNYMKSVSDCMRDATRVMIQEMRNLSALLHWCQVGQSPTWAVHWHSHKHIDILQRPVWSHVPITSTPISLDPRLFDLDLMEKNPGLNALLVKGLPISLVHSTTSTLTVDAPDEPFSWSTLEGVLRLVMDLSTRSGFKFSPRTIALTLILSVHDSQISTPEADGFRRLEDLIRNIWDGLHDQRPEQCLNVLLSDRSIYGHFVCLCNNKKLFVTEAGQLCMGPAEVQEGDKIVHLFGLRLPALLRPEHSWFTFAGVANLDSEFPDVQDTSTLPPEIFEIR